MKGSAALRKDDTTIDGWRGFEPGDWVTSIDVRDFIVRNVTPYSGDENFLRRRLAAHQGGLGQAAALFSRKSGRRACSPSTRKTPSTLLAHKAGYIDRDNEVIVGLQTDQPFKRAIFPYGGLRMVEAGLKAAGFEADPQVHEAFTKYRKTHNDGVFDAYTPEIMSCRRSGIITGLPDAYGRGRIIGDYRRVALYGVDRLLEVKRAGARADRRHVADAMRSSASREELAEQMRALKDLAAMAKLYDCDITQPGSERAGGRAVDLFRLSRRDQGGQRRGDVDRPHLELPRYLHRARPEGRHARRSRRAGAVGPAGAEAAHRALPPHAGLRRAVQRRSLLGDRMRRRHGPRRAAAGDQEQLPHAAHALPISARRRSRTSRCCGRQHMPDDLQALLRQGQQGHVVAAVRKRRPDAPALGRRLRHRLLRLGDAARQADAVLRRPRESRQGAALRHQWRPRRDLRRPDCAADRRR